MAQAITITDSQDQTLQKMLDKATDDPDEDLVADVTAIDANTQSPSFRGIRGFDTEDLEGKIRVRFTEPWKSTIAELLSLVRRREVLPHFKQYPDEVSEEAHPDAYKDLKQKFAASDGDTIVLSASDLVTLRDMDATYLSEVQPELDNEPSRYRTAINYCVSTIERAERILYLENNR